MAEPKKFDRSAFKSTVSAEQLKAEDQKVDKLSGRKEYDNNFATFHKIEDGLNKFRIYPAHPNENGHSFVVAVQKWWLEVEVPERDGEGKEKKDGDGNTIMKIGRKPIFDARIHSSVGKDIVNEYIEFLTKMLREEGMDEAQIQNKLLPIYGKYSSIPAQRIQGITGKPEWFMYADKITGDQKEFGKLTIGKAVKMRLNDIIATEAADEPLGSESTNPFTDPDDGRLLFITYNKNATKPADYYKTDIDSSFDKTTKQINLVPLNDDDLTAFMEFDSLHKQYVDCYTARDFNFAMEGLKNLDEANDFGVFQYEEFLDICEELSTAYPEPEAKTESSNSEKKAEEVGEFDFDNMTRNQLKIFNKNNNCGIVVVKSMSDDEIREQLYSWLDVQEKAAAGDESIEEPEEVEEEIEEVEEAVEEEVEEEEVEDPAEGDLPWEGEEEEEVPEEVEEEPAEEKKPATKKAAPKKTAAKKSGGKGEMSTADRIKALRAKQENK